MKSNIVPLPRQHAPKESPTAALEEAMDSVVSELVLLTGRIVDSLISAQEEALGRLHEFNPPQRLLTTKEAAAYLSVHYKTLLSWCSGEIPLPFILLGSERRFRLRDLDRWLDERTLGKQKIKL